MLFCLKNKYQYSRDQGWTRLPRPKAGGNKFSVTGVSPKWVKSRRRRKRKLQGLGAGPGSTTERWPCRKNTRKSVLFFRKKFKLPYFFYIYIPSSYGGKQIQVIFCLQKKMILPFFFCTASVRSWSLDQPLVPGVLALISHALVLSIKFLMLEYV